MQTGWVARFPDGLQSYSKGIEAVWLQAPRTDHGQGLDASCAASGSPQQTTELLGISEALMALDRNLHNSYQLPLCQPLDSRDESENAWIFVFRSPILITGLSEADKSFSPFSIPKPGTENQDLCSQRGSCFLTSLCSVSSGFQHERHFNTWNNLKYVKLGIAIILIFSGYLLAQSRK